MAQLDAARIKKLKTGELTGFIATGFCAAVLVYAIVMFSLFMTGREELGVVLWSTAPALMALGLSIAAFCNIKFGGEIEKLIKSYILDVCVENAALMHPERNSLTFFIELGDSDVRLTVNGYKEAIVFDFSAFGKLSLTRKMAVMRILTERLCVTFCRLYERGAKYKSVEYIEKSSSLKKSGKVIHIISDGVPDKKSYKIYLKNR